MTHPSDSHTAIECHAAAVVLMLSIFIYRLQFPDFDPLSETQNAILSVGLATLVVLWGWSLQLSIRAIRNGLPFVWPQRIITLSIIELVPLQLITWLLFGRDN